jgi:hypothetical protein
MRIEMAYFRKSCSDIAAAIAVERRCPTASGAAPYKHGRPALVDEV